MQLFKKSRKELINEWAPVLDKFEVNEKDRANTAAVLAGVCEGRTAEEVLELIEKAQKDNEGKTAKQLSEVNVTGDVAQWTSVVIPMMARSLPGVIGPEIFGFQPTSTPNALIFYLTRHYTNDSANEAKPATSKILTVASSTPFTVGGAISGETSGASATVRYIEGNNLLVSAVTGGPFIDGENLDNVASFSATETTLASQYDTEFAYKIAFKDYNAYATVALAEAATTNMKEIQLRIQSTSVNVKDHQIKIAWTRQMEYDLRQVHGQDAEAILSNAAAQEFAIALNQQMLSFVKTSAAAGGNVNFNYSSADGRWELEKYQNLLAVINRSSASLIVDNFFGEGNFLIMDPIMFASLDTMGLIDKSSLPSGMSNAIISPFCGTLLGRYRVYVDVFQSGTSGSGGERYIYIGYKDFSNAPDSEMKAGYFLSMYKAIDSIKLVKEDSGHPLKIYESRYAITANPFGADKYFRMVTVQNLPS